MQKFVPVKSYVTIFRGPSLLFRALAVLGKCGNYDFNSIWIEIFVF